MALKAKRPKGARQQGEASTTYTSMLNLSRLDSRCTQTHWLRERETEHGVQQTGTLAERDTHTHWLRDKKTWCKAHIHIG